MPDRLKAEQEITSIVSNLYQYCITSNKEAFLETTFEGYKIHSPSDYLSFRKFAGPMFDGFKLKPFPERLYFIRGSNLVFVYSEFGDCDSVLFGALTKESGSVGGVDFAYIDNRWIVW